MQRTILLAVLSTLFNVAFSHLQLEVLYAPDSLILQNTNNSLESSEFVKFASLCLGYTTEQPTEWDGFYGYKHFKNIPQSIVVFQVPNSLEHIASHSFAMEETSNAEEQYNEIMNLMRTKYENSFTKKINLSGKDHSTKTLNEQVDGLKAYVTHLEDIKSKSLLSQRMALWFTFGASYKPNDITAVKFETKLNEVMKHVRNLLDDQVVILALVDDGSLSLKRTIRQANAGKDTSPDYNLAYAYSEDFHIAFATIGFTTILLLLITYAVSIAMWNIDPGRDSIIYRLTSQKIKKDQ